MLLMYYNIKVKSLCVSDKYVPRYLIHQSLSVKKILEKNFGKKIWKKKNLEKKFWKKKFWKKKIEISLNS